MAHESHADWVVLARDTLDALNTAAAEAMHHPVHSNWDADAVAVRLLLRACGNLDGVILLVLAGLVAESRTVARSLIENSFCVAALRENAQSFIEMLRADSERSRRNQADFILKAFSDDPSDKTRLQERLEAIDKKNSLINIKKLASEGPLARQYLGYQRLSDESAHVTARALQRHVELIKDGWRYRTARGTPEESASTLHYAVLAALGVGIGVTEIIHAVESNAAFGPLCDRFAAMPAVATI
ncbi:MULTISPECIES: DUF5677 domain-containing protein [Cupriavidus]|jgi:Family of unknown function (DUF5677)|uniref:DUF5677 domain-containing protein n=1 Tax=Cupriavidus TaxID=106589 RepID=UPI0004678071|nr:DUF5677 domain-containing protein [Cupriavidus metallidurans]AVA38307.1 hypothetical protein C3Z06_32395 [Cupriavidus metallidurans]KWW32309.1 hypothetical protein AU374_05909 [Cupriavidus metallidurans]